jgi:methyltransferase-like protein
MEEIFSLKNRFIPSDNVVARKIEDEMLIIPLTSGIGNLDEELYSLNSSAQVIWQYLDGKNTLQDIVELLLMNLDSTRERLEEDVLGLLKELYERRIVRML